MSHSSEGPVAALVRNAALRYPESLASPGARAIDALVGAAIAGVSGGDGDLGPFVPAGSRVMVLPNFVRHRRPNESLEDFRGKCTHASVLKPVLDRCIAASGSAERVRFGNAPLQGADFARVVEETGTAELCRLMGSEPGAGIGPYDLRRYVTEWGPRANFLGGHERDEPMVAVDLGRDSLLDPFFQARPDVAVRVSDYAPEATMSYHGPGRHVYVVNRRVLEADVVISVPKLKTHQKVGITCALKGLVGTIASKECLAHHRKGGPGDGGDEYAPGTPFASLASELSERSARQPKGALADALRLVGKGLTRGIRRFGNGSMNGAWFGNDTAWRMTLDIGRVIRHARLDGTLSDVPVRRHLVLIDGIVAGEGEGPLLVTAKPLGVVIFGVDEVWSDYVCARAMGFDPAKIPLIAEALHLTKYALTNRPPFPSVSVEGALVAAQDVPPVAETFLAPKGWRGHVEGASLKLAG